MHTPEEVAAFKDQYAQRRQKQLIATIPAIGAVLVLALLGDKREEDFLGLSADTVGVLLFVVIAGVVAFSFFNWRCPACNGYLGRTWNPSFCSKCGVALR